MAKHGRRFLSASQTFLMANIMDVIVPAGMGFPGAGELNVMRHVNSVVAGSANLRRLFVDGLNMIEIVSVSRFQQTFASLSGENQLKVLNEIESKQPSFFNELVRHTYAGYYSTPEILSLLGLEKRPPQPFGYEMEDFDVDLVQEVQKRGRIYREV